MKIKGWKRFSFLFSIIAFFFFLYFGGYSEASSETFETAKNPFPFEGRNEIRGNDEPPPPPPGVYYAPTVDTYAVSNILSDRATSGGEVLSNGGASIVARGVCWSTGLNPTTANNCTANGTGTGTFSSTITGLKSECIYHLRAYATSKDPYGIVRTGYGEDIAFKTLPSCPDCSGGLLENTTFPADLDCRCICKKTLVIGPNVTLEPNSKVTVQAPKVIFVNKVHIKRGANLKVE